MLARRSLVVATTITLTATVLVFILTFKQYDSPVKKSIFISENSNSQPICAKSRTNKSAQNAGILQEAQVNPEVKSTRPAHATNGSVLHSLFEPPLRTRGRYILDAKNTRFKLASINWYGANDVYFVPGGLETQHRSFIAATIRRMGFNSVRLPYSDELVLRNPTVPCPLVAANPDLAGKTALEVLEACVSALTEVGLGVIINNHITQAGWFDGYNLCDATWRNDYLGLSCRITQNETSWIQNWERIMKGFVSNPYVIGADLRNEIHGFWGTIHWSSWASAAERASEHLLDLQPNWLMFVEGLSSANDLSRVIARPIQLSRPNRLVYSSHVYSWSGWGNLDPFSRRKYTSFASQMHSNWGYLLHENIAPVWVGEFGAPRKPNAGDAHYWINLMQYLEEVNADFGYWALNPIKPGTGEDETYSVLNKDWNGAIEGDYRLEDMRRLMQSANKSSLRAENPRQLYRVK